MQFSTFFHCAALFGLTISVAIPEKSGKTLGKSSRDSTSPVEPALSLLNRQTCPNNIHSNQQTTYYSKGTSPTATTSCGTHFNPAFMTAAISVELENEIGGMYNACSRQIVVVDAETGKSVQLAIEDSNATGTLGKHALDITPAAYEALGGSTAGSDPGQRMITWYLVAGVEICF